MRYLTVFALTVFFHNIILGQSSNKNHDQWLGIERSDIVGSDGSILNKTLQLMYAEMHVDYSDCGSDCGLESWNQLNLEFTSSRYLNTRTFTRKNKVQDFLIELFDDKRRLIASYYLNEHQVNIEYHEEAYNSYIYRVDISIIPRIILKQTVSWNILEMTNK